jgi:hypothetical protein
MTAGQEVRTKQLDLLDASGVGHRTSTIQTAFHAEMIFCSAIVTGEIQTSRTTLPIHALSI